MRTTRGGSRGGAALWARPWRPKASRERKPSRTVSRRQPQIAIRAPRGRHWRFAAVAVAAQLCGGAVGCDGGRAARKKAETAEWYYKLGRDYFSKKKAALAKAELIKAIRYDPDHEAAHYLLGVIFFLEGVHADNYIDRAQCLKGEAAAEQKEAANVAFRQAEKHLLRAVKLGREAGKVNSDALNYLANVALHFKRSDQAVELCTKALDNITYSSRHVALGTRGQAYLRKGEPRKAARDLRQALFHQPKFCLGRYWLAKVYYEQKQFERSAAELRRVVADKACPIQEAYRLLGLAYLKQKMPAKAREQFEQCVTRNPKSCISKECARYAKMI